MAWIKQKPDIEQKTRLTKNRKEQKTDEIVKLKAENELLKKRIVETSETFFSQAQFFNSLLTLNEIQLLQSLVEATAHFLKATQTTIYLYKENDFSFKKSATFHKNDGLRLERKASTEDRLLFLIKETRNILTIREILHNKMLYQLWQNSESKALIYCPLFTGNHFIGILTVDEIPFHHLNRQTVKNLLGIAKLATSALRNVRSHQTVIVEKKRVQSKILTEYQEFLKTLNYEFKRAKRNNLPLSLIYVVLEHRRDHHEFNPVGIQLKTKIKTSCRKNLREVDFLFDDQKLGRIWIVLPVTDFNGLAYVLERITLLINMELASQTNYICHLGFGSLDTEIKHPKQMMETCIESYQLHRTVRTLVSKKKNYGITESTQETKSSDF